MTETLIAICARAFGVSSERLSDATGPENLPEWDSLRTLELLASLEEEYGVRLSIIVAAQLKSIADLRAALLARGVDVE